MAIAALGATAPSAQAQILQAYLDQNNDTYAEWIAQDGYTYLLQKSEDMELWETDSTWPGHGQTVSILVHEGPNNGGGGGGGAIPGLPSYSFGITTYSNGNSLISFSGTDGNPYQLYTTNTYFQQGDDPLFATEVTNPNGDYELFLHRNGIPLPANAASLTLGALPAAEQTRVGLLTSARAQIVSELAANGGTTTQTGAISASVGDKGFFRLLISRDDSDGDGLFDTIEELPAFNTNPFDPDSDQDGVTDPWDHANIGHVIISEFMASNDAVIADEDGDYEDYIEIFNPTSSTKNLAGHYLACNENSPLRWRFPFPAGGILLGPGESLVVFASGKNRKTPGGPYHTDFGLSASVGEDLLISNSSGVRLDAHLNWGRQRLNASAGWGLDQETGLVSALRFFLDPTPGFLNSPTSCTGLSDAPDFNINGGVFTSGVQFVTLTAADPTDEVYYTLDGSDPTIESLEYGGQSLQIDETTIVRAMAIKPGCLPSPVTARSFLYKTDVIGTGGQGNTAVGFQMKPPGYPTSFIVNGNKVGPLDYAMDPEVIEDNYNALAQELSDIPSLSVTLPVDKLFGATNGFYSRSQDAENKQDPLSNEWKRLASFEYIDPNVPGSYVQENGEITISGASSRKFSTTDKHNMRLSFKSKFSREGSSSIVFPNSPFDTTTVKKFTQLSLRQPTHDSWALKWDFPLRENATHVREAWAREMHRQMDPGNIIANRRWVHLYLNGIHWGIYELGERIDQDFARTYGSAMKNYDVIKQGLEVVDGNTLGYNAMIAACNAAQASPGSSTLWNSVKDILDVNSYIDYLIVNMFMDNSDWWTGNNWRAFRRQTDLANPADKAQFKFVVWDAEYAMDPANINRNNTGFSNGALQAHGILLTHPSYKAAWKLRVQKHFEIPNGVYSVSGANHVASSVFDGQMDLFEEVVTTESARWGDANRATAFSSAEWTTAAQEHRDDYIKNRRSKFLNQLKARGLANP